MSQPARTNAAPSGATHAYAADALPLLCALGRHSPERLPVWNEGYYFARCERCHRDIVRPLDGKWEIPRGFRVVWQRERPETEATPTLVGGEDEPPLPFGSPDGQAVGERHEADTPAVTALPDEAPDEAPGEAVSHDADRAEHGAADKAEPHDHAEAEPAAPASEDWRRNVIAWTAEPPDGREPEHAEADHDAEAVHADAERLEEGEHDPLLDQDEAALDAANEEEPVEEPHAAARRSLIPDFMDDGAPLPAPLIPQAAPVAAASIDASDTALARSVRSELDRMGLGNLAAMTNRVFQDKDDRPGSAANGASRRGWRIPSGTIAAVVVAVLLTMMTTIAWERRQTGATAPSSMYQPAPVLSGAPQVASSGADVAAVAPSAPVRAVAPTVRPTPAAKPQALRPVAKADRIVVASVLNCRATPTPSAPVRMKFRRGAVVTMETARGHWVSISRKGQSCWVQSQLIEGS